MRQPMEITMLILFLCYLLAFTVEVQGQFESGFISVDCGLAQGSSYSDATTELQYSSDEGYVHTGINANISPDFMSNSLPRHMSSVRSFPQGINNCYTFKPEQVAAKDNKYLIRAIFMYGNYDSKNQPPEFGLYLDVNEWDTVKLENASVIVTKEIIHMPKSDYIHVCLVNTGSGTPFISALELRQLDNSTYITTSDSLVLRRRLDFGSTTNKQYRYKDDVYDRIWEPAGEMANMESVSVLDTSTTGLRDPGYYKPPYAVMRTAVRPVNGSSLDYYYTPPDPSKGFYFYEHFAEVEEIQSNQKRKFNISDHDIDKTYLDNENPTYLNAYIVFSAKAEYAAEGRFQLSFNRTDDSTLPPILNALEIYEGKNFPQSPTHQIEVDAMMLIKSTYGVEKNWQGDPCVPRDYYWEGIRCRYKGENSPTIISLNLSSNGLSGNIASSLSNLKSLQSLDLSNNSLTGPVPDFLSQMSLLLRINLSRNKLSGSVPAALIEKKNNGSLQSFSVDGNPKLCDKTTSTCKKKKKNVIIPVVVSVVSCLVLLSALVILWSFKRRKQQGTRSLGKPKQENEALEPKARQFTFSEVVNITSNFTRVLGKGGFGTVYGGNLEDGTQVAVKMLSLSSTQGSKEFRAEAQLLTRVHHRNLVTFVGYCNEGERMGLIYEYMANGSLQDHLSEKNAAVLSWSQRIRIAVDAAQGLEYLHNGCKPPIIHRDVKTSNILLNDKMQAKVSDFGLSKFMPPDGGSHISTTVVGTPGYLDPEYYVSNWLNEKSDVYSFGILLLELITGRTAIIKVHENLHIVEWVKAMLERGEISSIMDSRLKEEELKTNSIWKVVETAMACVEAYSIQRPTMSHVLVELKECLELQMAAERSSKSTTNLHVSTNSLVIDFESSVGPHAR